MALNERMMEADALFRKFGALYSEGEVGIKDKELIGLAISIVTRCDECAMHHLDRSRDESAGRKEILEAIKIGVVAGDSITFPNARSAFAALDNGGV